jgi:hypothetical protein
VRGDAAAPEAKDSAKVLANGLRAASVPKLPAVSNSHHDEDLIRRGASATDTIIVSK